MSIDVTFLEDIGFVGGELKYVAIHFRSVMKKRLPFSIGTAWHNRMAKPRGTDSHSRITSHCTVDCCDSLFPTGTAIRDHIRKWIDSERGRCGSCIPYSRNNMKIYEIIGNIISEHAKDDKDDRSAPW